MAAIAISAASVTLATIANPLVKHAYGKIMSAKNAEKDLVRLAKSINIFKAVLQDAEKRQEEEEEEGVKQWMDRVKDVLYDADDLFDEIATTTELKKLKTERYYSFPNFSIARRIKEIRKAMDDLANDMMVSKFSKSILVVEKRERTDPGFLFDPKTVIGRDNDKKAILDMLLGDSNNNPEQDVSVIAVVGIGGMGKTTLAHLVFNDEKVNDTFAERWFVRISYTTDHEEVIRKIYMSVCQGNERELPTIDQQNKIRQALHNKKYLLVLDDVWDHDRNRWAHSMSLLTSGAKDSKIIVTTRSDLVSRAVGAGSAMYTHKLEGLSDKDSWDLFKYVAGLTPEEERDPEWAESGEEILKKCANVPLAIRSIASLLFEKKTQREWNKFRNQSLPKLSKMQDGDGIMHVLKFSYEHLPLTLKPCFAYCSMFPKDDYFSRDALIYLWHSQGYIELNDDMTTIEDEGYSYFNDLLRRSFLQVEYLYGDEFPVYKMHDLMHDLALLVAGEESVPLLTSSDKIDGIRHASISYDEQYSWDVNPRPTQNVKRLRSFLYLGKVPPHQSRTLNIQIGRFKSLRALSLIHFGLERVSSDIGELVHLRYLDLSFNNFESLPDSITKLVNLCTLQIVGCQRLGALPVQFRKLINLRSLRNASCPALLPPGCEALTSLQRLDVFVVSREINGPQTDKLGMLSELNLRGRLSIHFRQGIKDWDGLQNWKPPLNLEVLDIFGYQGPKIPHWGNIGVNYISGLTLTHCPFVWECLPPFRHLPHLKQITLWNLGNLEYIQGAEEEGQHSLNESFLPPKLENLYLSLMAKLKGWSRRLETTWPHELPSFPSLTELTIDVCPQINHMPLCPNLTKLRLSFLKKQGLIYQLLQPSSSDDTLFPLTLTTRHLPLPSLPSSLQSVQIQRCDFMLDFPGKSLTSLQKLNISHCNNLFFVDLPPSGLNKIEELLLYDCQDLDLWGEYHKSVDWDSLPRLAKLTVPPLLPSTTLPECLQVRQQGGRLIIKHDASTSGTRKADRMFQDLMQLQKQQAKLLRDWPSG